MKYNLLPIILVLPMQFVLAQPENTLLKGHIKYEQGNCVPFATLLIENTTKRTINDTRGNFKLTNLTALQSVLVRSTMSLSGNDQLYLLAGLKIGFENLPNQEYFGSPLSGI
jgi:hypothetical protein